MANAGYSQNFFWDNIKLSLMFFSCVFAMVAQFFPIPFPASRPLLGVCCVGYFVLSTVLQYIITYIDKDTIIITNPTKVNSTLIHCISSVSFLSNDKLKTVHKYDFNFIFKRDLLAKCVFEQLSLAFRRLLLLLYKRKIQNLRKRSGKCMLGSTLPRKGNLMR